MNAMTFAFLNIQLRGFGVIDYIVFIIYLAASVFIGVYFVKEQKSVRDYFLAGRSMGWFVIAISVIAALFSGISYLGAPTEAYNHNLVYACTLLAFFVATPVTITISSSTTLMSTSSAASMCG